MFSLQRPLNSILEIYLGASFYQGGYILQLQANELFFLIILYDFIKPRNWLFIQPLSLQFPSKI